MGPACCEGFFHEKLCVSLELLNLFCRISVKIIYVFLNYNTCMIFFLNHVDVNALMHIGIINIHKSQISRTRVEKNKEVHRNPYLQKIRVRSRYSSMALPEVAPRERGGRKVDGKHPLFLSLAGAFVKTTDYISHIPGAYGAGEREISPSNIIKSGS